MPTPWPDIQHELRRLAEATMRDESSDHTLQPTALVNEAWLRLREQRNLVDVPREKFIAAAATIMRRILVDHARAKRRDKRGGGWTRVPIDVAEERGSDGLVDLVALDDAMNTLAKLSPRQAQVVELRFFGGLDMTEIAGELDLSRETVHQDWNFARAWLFERLGGEGG